MQKLEEAINRLFPVAAMNPYGLILQEIEDGLWEHDFRVSDGIAFPYSYDYETFRACIKIFMESMLWRMVEHMNGKSEGEVELSSENMATEIRAVILKYTGIDTHDLHKEKPGHITETGQQLPV